MGRWPPSLRQLHSLAGLGPLSLFLLAHLWVQSHVLEGQLGYASAMAGRWWADSALVRFAVLFPLALHGVVGIGLAVRRRYDLRHNPSAANWRRALQSVTGLLAAAFVVVHFTTLVVPLDRGRLAAADAYPALSAQLSTTLSGMPLYALAYALGAGVCAFHLGNGLWSASLRWLQGRGTALRRLAMAAYALVALAAMGLGLNTTIHLATGAALPWPHGPAQAPQDGEPSVGVECSTGQGDTSSAHR